MKTMTCKQLGGPCDFAHHGATADEVIKAQDRHLKDNGQRWRRRAPAGIEGDERPVEAPHLGNGMVQAGQARFWRSSRGLNDIIGGRRHQDTRIESNMVSGAVPLGADRFREASSHAFPPPAAPAKASAGRVAAVGGISPLEAAQPPT